MAYETSDRTWHSNRFMRILRELIIFLLCEIVFTNNVMFRHRYVFYYKTVNIYNRPLLVIYFDICFCYLYIILPYIETHDANHWPIWRSKWIYIPFIWFISQHIFFFLEMRAIAKEMFPWTHKTLHFYRIYLAMGISIFINPTRNVHVYH